MTNYINYSQGSNFQTGFAAGNFQIPMRNNPGVPVGLVQLYKIFPAFDATVITANVSGTQYIPLAGFTFGTLKYLSENEPYIELDYARCLKVSAGTPADFEFEINYLDQYGQPGIYIGYSDTISGIGLTPAVFGITAIGIKPLSGNISVTISTTNIYELPYTDNGVPSQLICYTKNNHLAVITSGENSPFNFVWDGKYSVAYTAPPTAYVSQIRPLIEVLDGGEEYTSFPDNICFTFQQNVYGLGNSSEYRNPDLPQVRISVDEEEKYKVYGHAPHNIGWKGWQG